MNRKIKKDMIKLYCMQQMSFQNMNRLKLNKMPLKLNLYLNNIPGQQWKIYKNKIMTVRSIFYIECRIKEIFEA